MTIYVWYAVLSILNFLVTYLVAYPIAPILPLFASLQMGWCDNHSYQAIGPRLPKWLGLFQTPDNSLDGDATFQKLNPPSYWSKVRWLWRNPAYSFALRYITAPYSTTVNGDPSIKDNDNAKAGWCFVKSNGLFQFVLVSPIGFSRCIYINLGWNIRGLVDPNVNPKPDQWQATFVCSPRISGFR